MNAAEAQKCQCPKCIEPPAPVPPPPPVRIDLGCGKAKREGFIGVDALAFDSVDKVCNLGAERWPFDDDSVDEAHCSHMVEHLTAKERAHFVNELHRVLKKGGKCLIVVPNWRSSRAYGDPTHVWPPVTEFWPPYLQAAWRKDNAPHVDLYTCDFDATQPGYSPHPSIALRSADYQQEALLHYCEAALDTMFTLIKR